MTNFQLRTQYPELKSTISHAGRGYVVTRPCGKRIRCHNLGTARWFVANPQAK